MSESHAPDALPTQETEPLLAIEKKLIGFSLGLGVALLVLLTILTRATAIF
jgi:hypothetical protein